MKIRRQIRSIITGIAMTGLLSISACVGSGPPRGSFPAKAGDFTLVNGPITQKEDKESKGPANFLAEYRSSTGATIAHQLMPFDSAELAAKAFAEKKENAQYGRPGFMAYAAGDKLVTVDPGGTTTVYWAANNWYCYTSSKKGDAATQLAASLEYK